MLFAGCEPEVAAGLDGRILAVGVGAREAAAAAQRWFVFAVALGPE